MRMTLLKKLTAPRCVALTLVAAATLMTGCVTNTEGGPANTNAAGASNLPVSDGGQPSDWVEIKPEKVEKIAALVPAEVAADGKLTIGTNPPFAPAEFKDSEGNIIGFDIDLARAVASIMGLELEIKELDFALILPQIFGGTVELGASGFTDNEERRQSFDFVNYFNAGIQWGSIPGTKVNPDDACGLTIAVQRTTVSDVEDVTVRSKKCEEAGKKPINKLAFDSSDAAANAVILGRADAFSADSPVTAWAIARSEGRLTTVGEVFDSAHYGWPVKKDSSLAPALAAALQHLVETGDYAKIMDQWGLGDGRITEALINGKPVK